MLGFDCLERLGEATVELGLKHIAVNMNHARGKEIPGLRIERLGNRCLRRIRDKAAHPVGEFFAKIFVRLLRAVDADKRKLVGQSASPGQVIECRHQQPFRQIAAGPKDHHRAGRRLDGARRAAGSRIELGIHRPLLSFRRLLVSAELLAHRRQDALGEGVVLA